MTTIKKDKRAEKNICQVKCFNWHKKGHHANKFADKQPKN